MQACITIFQNHWGPRLITRMLHESYVTLPVFFRVLLLLEQAHKSKLRILIVDSNGIWLKEASQTNIQPSIRNMIFTAPLPCSRAAGIHPVPNILVYMNMSWERHSNIKVAQKHTTEYLQQQKKAYLDQVFWWVYAETLHKCWLSAFFFLGRSLYTTKAYNAAEFGEKLKAYWSLMLKHVQTLAHQQKTKPTPRHRFEQEHPWISCARTC